METKKKKPSFHVDLIEFDHKTIPDFRFCPISLLLVQYCFWSIRGCLLKVFIAKLLICILFVETKKKVPIFHVDLIEFNHKTIPDFWFFQYLFYWSKTASGVLEGAFWKYSEQSYQYASFMRKRRKRILFFTLVWLYLTMKRSMIFDFFPISLLLIQYCFWSIGGCLLKVFIAKLPICIVFVETKKKIPNFYVDLIEFDHKTIPDFWFFQISFHRSKNASGVPWGTYWKYAEQNYQYAYFLWKRRKTNLFFMLIWLNLTIKQSLIFDFFQYLFHRSKNASGILGALVETFLSKTTNLHRFRGNE